MLTAICPYCSNGIDILSDDCIKILKYKGKISCECNNIKCGMSFIVYHTSDEKIKSIKREDYK